MPKKPLIAIIFALVVPLAVFAYTSPGRPTGYVSDFADVIPPAQEQAIEAKLESLKAQTGDEVAVATVKSLGGDTIENYAVQLFQEWGIGEKGKDDGVLILVAPNEREARIEVGYGLEGDLTDLQSGQIVRGTMIPYFQKGDYAGGISAAVDSVSGILTGAAATAPADLSASGGSRGGSGNYFGFIVFVAIISMNVLSLTLGRTKSWWLGGVLGAVAGVVIGLIWGFFFTGIISIAGLSILGLVFDYIVSKNGGGRGGRGGGFWFLGGGRGGLGGGSGFGGFGGGFSGGGGASGRW